MAVIGSALQLAQMASVLPAVWGDDCGIAHHFAQPLTQPPPAGCLTSLPYVLEACNCLVW